ncbi:cytochrome c oxidase subunit 3 [Crenobacter sp. SG2303]|uniref:Cytochrome c oxidase subunit 3 n=1 Tax=Crenobacter oryzisoli TaxID=3056844 RepID=A0ABT7XN62_9NEIS|nr:cytochrome c oxidase subunit 3 [Crenobacter sp. SG2303]MDN0075226.1 cytochrome c oxidase subunit 3 [Crenobacter sp. SG2303]
MMGTVIPMDGVRSQSGRSRPGKVGLWVFLAVVTMLFTLLLFAYLMRMQFADWRALPLPWQLWLSTVLLAASSTALFIAHRCVQRGRWREVRAFVLAGGACAAAFVAGQLWAWQQLAEQHYLVAGNPANSFFYLLTGLHGLHVLGGLIGLALTMARLRRGSEQAGGYVQLCARYWHFLFAVWLVLFTVMGTVTPALARSICGGLLS